MLIDGAIVVTEEADRRMLAGSPRQAAYSGAAMRMFWPVTASVATTLAAFLPLVLAGHGWQVYAVSAPSLRFSVAACFIPCFSRQRLAL